MAWRHTEDTSLDMWAFSDYPGHDVDIHKPPPPTILQYNARLGANNNVSIFDPEFPHEEVTYVSSGRGRGGVSKFFKPGLPVNPCLDDEEDIKRRLREVSGLGYSNELIEHRFKKTVPTPSPVNETEFCDVSDEHDDYQSLVIRTPEQNRYSSPVSSKTESHRISTTSLSSNTSSPKKEKPIDNQIRPLPLSLILKKAKEKTSSTNKENNCAVESSSRSNGQMKVLKSQLNPDAIEFKLPLPGCSSRSTSSTQDKEESSIFNQEQIPIEYDSGANGNSRCSSRSSTGDELSWRRRDGKDSSKPLFNWNRPGNGYSSEEDNSYRNAISRRNGRRRDFSRMEVFDIHSDSDFPTLT